jgi:hypothetical protein
MRAVVVAALTAATAAAAAAPAVDLSGPWSHGTEPTETYALTTTDAAGDAVAVPTGTRTGWAYANITVVNATAGAVYVRFSNGAAHGGVWAAPGGVVASIAWDGGSTWVRSSPRALTLHVVPHSHNDPGWKATVEQLYDTDVRAIYSSVVAALVAGPARTFGAEIGVFWTMWWGEQNDTTRAAVRDLVAGGRLEFVGGGYTQPDEAATTAADLADNLALGRLWAASVLGAPPVTIGWQADPFGHSSGYGALHAAAAADALVLGRPMSAGAWGSDPVNGQSGVLWHPLASHPGGNNGSGGFDGYTLLLHDQQSGYWQPGRDCEPAIAAGNATAVAAVLAAYARALAGRPPYTSTVLLLVGDDFYWQTADAQLPVLDAALALVNAGDPAVVGPGPPLAAAYSTPSRWAAALRAEQLARAAAGNDTLAFPARGAVDFFPLECCEFPKPWVGYYTSRPEFKQAFRAAGSAWRAATQLHSWARGADWEAGVGGLLPLWRALSLVQHHDAITGDAFDAVMEDYRYQVDAGVAAAAAVAGGALAALAGGRGLPPALCANASAVPCAAIAGPLGDRQPVVVTVHNPLSQPRDEVVVLAVPGGLLADGLAVTDAATGAPVLAQGDPDVGSLAWVAAGVPAHGFRSYLLAPATAAAEAAVGRVVLARRRPVSVPAGSAAHLPDVVLANANVSLTFAANGSLAAVTVFDSTGAPALTSPASSALGFYTSSPGDENAWDMSTGGATALRAFGGLVPQNAAVARGPLYDELAVYVDAAQGAGVVWRVYHGAAGALTAGVHVTSTAGPLGAPLPGNASYDVAVRVCVAAVDSGAGFATDSNGLELVRRVRDGRPWVAGPAPRPDEPVAHNYYPVTAAVAAVSAADPAGGPGVALLTGSPQGGSSLASGCLELGMNRVVRDGSGGLATGNRLVTATNVLLLSAGGGWGALTGALRPAAVALGDPLGVWAAPAAGVPPGPARAPFAPLAPGALPPSVALVSLQTLPPGLNVSAAFGGGATGAPLAAAAVLVRLRHVYAAGEGAAGQDAPVTLDLRAVFAPRWNVTACTETTLDGARPLAAARAAQIPWNEAAGGGGVGGGGPTASVGADFVVTLAPMDFRTFVLAVAA